MSGGSGGLVPSGGSQGESDFSLTFALSRGVVHSLTLGHLPPSSKPALFHLFDYSSLTVSPLTLFCLPLPILRILVIILESR